MSDGKETVWVFANPIAGAGQGAVVAEHWRRTMEAQGFEVRLFLQQQIASDLPKPRTVIAIGGDGTIRAVVQQLVKRFGSAVPPVLPVPMGTANLLVKHLAAKSHNVKSEIIHLDAGIANGEIFLLMAGVGIDATVVRELSRMRRGPISLMSYLWPTIKALATHDFAPVTVTADGITVCTDRTAMVFAGNVREYGTGFPILPEARTDDGVLDLCVLPCRSRAQMMQLLLLAAAGEHLHAEGVVYVKCRSIRVESERPVPVQVDGEAFGNTPLQLDLLPFRVPFIVPQL